jgi:ABC-type transport system involved in cytochrome bd biosynthesis fused ATPase/permease subunit
MSSPHIRYDITKSNFFDSFQGEKCETHLKSKKIQIVVVAAACMHAVVLVLVLVVIIIIIIIIIDSQL